MQNFPVLRQRVTASLLRNLKKLLYRSYYRRIADCVEQIYFNNNLGMKIRIPANLIYGILLRPNKKISVSRVTGLKILGR